MIGRERGRRIRKNWARTSKEFKTVITYGVKLHWEGKN